MTGTNEEERAFVDTMVRSQIAFYGSTPTYRPVLDLHGWGDLQTELNALSKQGRWTDMAELIDDDVLDAFAVVAEPARVADELLGRFGGAVTRLSFYVQGNPSGEAWRKIVNALQALPEQRYGRIWTGTPSGRMPARKVIPSFDIRMQPWLTCWPSSSGSLVPWSPMTPSPPAKLVSWSEKPESP